MQKQFAPEKLVPSAPVFGEYSSLRSHLGPNIPRAPMAERAQAEFTSRKIMAVAQAQSKLKRAIKHRSLKIQDYVYSLGDLAIVWRDSIVNNSIGEFIGKFKGPTQ